MITIKQTLTVACCTAFAVLMLGWCFNGRLHTRKAIFAFAIATFLCALCNDWKKFTSRVAATNARKDAELRTKTIADLRMYMAATAVKNTLVMIDEFEAGCPAYLQHEESEFVRLASERARWEHDV